jgi:predicted house-cleaning noncanonical NTP pyrophosphatase (MazG superfamily)
MNEKRAAFLRTHQMNIERYQNLLKTKLSEAEVNFLERRLAEERFAVAMLDFMSPNVSLKGRDFREALE